MISLKIFISSLIIIIFFNINQNERRRLELEYLLMRKAIYVNWQINITIITLVSHIKRLYLATKSIRAFQKLQASKAKVIQRKFKDHLVKSKKESKQKLFQFSARFLLLRFKYVY